MADNLSKKFSELLWLFTMSVCLMVNKPVVLAQTVQLPDTVFRIFLSNNYPNVIDLNNRLITTEAAKITGTIDASNQEIASIEGIQFFTGLSAIKFVRTGLTAVPDLSSMVNLKGISLMYNNISALPSLSNLKKLETLLVHGNKLVAMPDLSQNVNLIEININANLIDSLSGLAFLAKVETLSVHNNRLKSLPGIDQMVSLKEFRCNNNPMGNFPLLGRLTNIQEFDASKCQLTEAPNFGTKSTIKSLNIDRNKIVLLPDYTGYDNLTNVTLEYNKLTFSELTKLTNKKGYDTIFKIAPQQNLIVGKPITLTEGNPYTFSSGIDGQVASVNYSWYKNGTKTASVIGDKSNIPYVQLQDSGKYTCQLTHPAFANFSLQTDTFSVSVAPCMDLNKVSIATTRSNCQKSGSLEVTIPAVNNYTFELKSLGSGKLFTSTNGKFDGLSEPSYTLSIATSTGCKKIYPKEINVSTQKCLEYVLTPNNDGNADTFFFETTGKVEIYDKWGNIVKRMNTPSEWDCTSDKGKIPNGYYIANVNDGETHIGLSVVY